MLQTLTGHLKNTAENVYLFTKCQVNFVVAVGVLKLMKALELTERAHLHKKSAKKATKT